MQITAQISGVDSVKANFMQSLNSFKESVKNEVYKATRETEGQAHNNVDKSTKYLPNSIGSEFFDNGFRGVVFAGRGLPLPQIAAYEEFGTGIYVDVTEGFEDYAWTFYVNGKGKKHARPFLIPAYVEKSKQFIDNLKKIAKDYSG